MPEGLAFDPLSGVLSGTPMEPTAGLLTLRAYDTSWAFNDAIAILPIAVDPPVLAISMPPIPAAKVGEPFQLAPSVSGTLGSVSWTVVSGDLPAGVTLDGLSGVVADTPVMWGTTSAVVQVLDSDRWKLNRTVADTVTITVAPRSVAILTSALPGGVYRTHYDAALSATGGTGQYTWSVVGGEVPPGLQVTSSGAVVGEPQTIGRFNFTVQLTDAWPGPDYTATAPVAVVIAPVPIAITTAALPSGHVRKPYRAALQFTGGTGTPTWSMLDGVLPDGLTLSSDGVISGKPKAVGTFSFTVQASDAGWEGNVAAHSFSVTIRARELVLYALDAGTINGTWSLVADATAADGWRIWNPNKSAWKTPTPLALPANYFEITFQAEAGVAYHLWLRGKADKDKRTNDAVVAQFSGSVDAAGAPTYRIGTRSGTTVNLADCNGCRLFGGGWQDNGFGVNVVGPDIYFDKSGEQTIRVQVKQDGFSIDQIVLSAETFLRVAPGPLKNDTTIVAR